MSSRRDSRTGGEVYNSVGSSKKSYKGGVFGSRVNATEQARDVERMNAEVCISCSSGGRGEGEGGRSYLLVASVT